MPDEPTDETPNPDDGIDTAEVVMDETTPGIPAPQSPTAARRPRRAVRRRAPPAPPSPPAPEPAMAQWPPANQPAEAVADRDERIAARGGPASCSSARSPVAWSARSSRPASSSPPTTTTARPRRVSSRRRRRRSPDRRHDHRASLDVAGDHRQGRARGRRDHDRRRTRQRRRRGDRLRHLVRRLHRDQQPRRRGREPDQVAFTDGTTKTATAPRARPGDRPRGAQGRRDGPAVGRRSATPTRCRSATRSWPSATRSRSRVA